MVDDAGQHWDIPRADREALRQRSLPRLELFTATSQTKPTPLVVPNLVLKPCHPGLYEPAVSLLSSSLTHFVDSSPSTASASTHM